MLVIGLTGGIGSGKTMVSDLFAQKGITVVDADVISRIVVEPESEGLKKLQAVFGNEIIDNQGHLDRRKLRNIVFADPGERKKLEAITHPLIGQELLRQLNASTSPYTVLVSPLLFETGQYKMATRILVVDASEASQIDRTIKRDKTTQEGVEGIIAAQMSREDRCKKADDIISNDKDLAHLQIEVERLHQQYSAMHE